MTVVDQESWSTYLYEIQVTVIDNSDILVAVTSECCVKRVIYKIWTGFSAGTLANSADPGQTPQNVASDQGLQCLLKLQNVLS